MVLITGNLQQTRLSRSEMSLRDGERCMSNIEPQEVASLLTDEPTLEILSGDQRATARVRLFIFKFYSLGLVLCIICMTNVYDRFKYYFCIIILVFI